MKFVIDTNIVFSAILNTESKIGDLPMNSHGVFEFYSCDALRAELKRHRHQLLDLSQLTEDQLDQAIYQISHCIVFTDEALIPFAYWAQAAQLVRDVDMDDIAFLALAGYMNVKLWTGDRRLMKGLASKGFSSFISTGERYTLRTLLE
ncbi:MAG: PIN domain-containing protein [Bacteroidia bacterium]|nr:PIN domain-containing protein [Bacteroidia bacterium]